jgi:endonuclease/exonuclease/phosphatase family metal-dependent hydrolase
MGDFNDVAESASIRILLKNNDGCIDSHLKIADVRDGFREGTLKYQGSWEKIDHFIVSADFYDGSSGFFLDDKSFRIFAPDFLLERDEKYGGFKPFRTWSGFSYNGGVSDHLPVLLKITRSFN